MLSAVGRWCIDKLATGDAGSAHRSPPVLGSFSGVNAAEAATEASPWSFGWEALVAIGTLGLAVATVVLALVTRALAESSTKEVRAQWRPVILPGLDRPQHRAALDVLMSSSQKVHLSVRIRNAGRGPALYVRAYLEPGGISPQTWSLGALAPEDELTLHFVLDRQGPESPSQLLFDYRDLAGRAHSTSATLVRTDGFLRFYDVRVWEDHSVTKLGDSVYPQPGLRDVSPGSAS